MAQPKQKYVCMLRKNQKKMKKKYYSPDLRRLGSLFAIAKRSWSEKRGGGLTFRSIGDMPVNTHTHTHTHIRTGSET